MTLALYGKSRKRQGSLMLAALFAILIATLGGVATFTSVFAHHTSHQLTANCTAGTWNYDADFFGGGQSGTPRRAKIYKNNVLVHTQDFTGLVNVANYYTDSGSLPLGAAITFRVEMFSGPNFTTDMDLEEPADVTLAAGSPCVKIHIKKVVTGSAASTSQLFTADVNNDGQGSGDSGSNDPTFSQNAPATYSWDEGSDTDDDFTVTELSTANYVATGTFVVPGNESCPVANSGDWDTSGDPSIASHGEFTALKNLANGDEVTVCFRNVFVPDVPHTCTAAGLVMLDKLKPDGGDGGSDWDIDDAGTPAGMQVTATGSPSGDVSWNSSPYGIELIIVKGGSGPVAYKSYDPNGGTSGSVNNDGLLNNGGQEPEISHIEFCVNPPANDLTADKTSDATTPGSFAEGGSFTFTGVPATDSFVWKIAIRNAGNASAQFNENEVIFKDNLPTNSGLTYSNLAVDNQGMDAGEFDDFTCTLTVNVIECKANNNKNVDIDSGDGFDVKVTAAPTSAGTYANPKSDGICKVDPTGKISESNEDNNTCSDTVIGRDPVVVAPSVKKVAHDPQFSGGYAFWDIVIDQPSSNGAAQTVTITDAYDVELVSSTGNACTEAGGVLTCNVPANTDVTAVVKRQVTAGNLATGNLCNGGTIKNYIVSATAAAQPDPIILTITEGGPTSGSAVSYNVPASPAECGQPAITKKGGGSQTEAFSVTDPADVKWTVQVINPSTLPGSSQTVWIKDQNVTVLADPTRTGGATCPADGSNNTNPSFQTALNTANGVECSMPADSQTSSSITFSVKPTTTPVRTCEDQTFNNTAYLKVGAGGSFVGAAGPTITLTGNPALCGRSIEVCKDNVFGGDTTFEFTVTGKPAFTITDAVGGGATCQTVTGVANSTVSVTESVGDRPASPGFTLYYVGTTPPATEAGGWLIGGGASLTTGQSKVTFRNAGFNGLTCESQGFFSFTTLSRVGGGGDGFQTTPVGYNYFMPSPLGFPAAGLKIDHHWVQTQGASGAANDYLVYDLGAGNFAKNVMVYPSIDHGPLPQEAHEVAAYGSNNNSTWTLLSDLGQVGDPTTWDSDNYPHKWGSAAAYRYFKLDPGAAGTHDDGDAEIDAACAMERVDPPKVGVDKDVDGGDGADYYPGNSFAFTITVNVSGTAGVLTTAPTTITDVVPAVFTINSVLESSAYVDSCGVVANTVTCTLLTGTPLGSYDITLNVTVVANPQTCGNVENTVTASGANADVQDTGFADVDIVCLGRIVVHKDEIGTVLESDSNTWNFVLVGSQTSDAGSINDEGSQTYDNLLPGTYSVQETNGIDGSCGGEIAYVTRSGLKGSIVSGATVTGIVVEAGQTTDVYFENEDCPGEVIIHKVYPAGVAGDGATFTGYLHFFGEGPADITWGPLAVNGSITVSNVPAGNWFDLVEDAKDGYEFIGIGESAEAACSGNQLPVEIDELLRAVLPFHVAGWTLEAGGSLELWICNHPYGDVTLVKVDNVVGSQDWTFESTIGDFNTSITDSGSVTHNSQTAGAYTVHEVNGLTQLQGCFGTGAAGYFTSYSISVGGVTTTPKTEIGSATINFSVAANSDTIVTVYNDGCEVAGDPLLLIQKFRDVNGDRTGTQGITGFTFIVKKSGVPIAGSPFTMTDGGNPGGLLLLQLQPGSYTVEEVVPNNGYVFSGTKTDIGDNGSFEFFTTTGNQPAAVNLVYGSNTRINFYNRPNGSIEVTKTTVTRHAGGSDVNVPQDRDGWKITISSVACGVGPIVGHTDTNGKVTFTNLPICSDYVVTEEVGISGTTGYVAVGSASVTGRTPGNPATQVGFTNRKDTNDPPCTTCVTLVTPTPTVVPPTATPVPPTATVKPTEKPTEKPKEDKPKDEPTTVDTALGEKTPGAQTTPIAPSTGSGIAGAAGSINGLLALVGLVVLGSGLAIVAVGRKQR